MINFNFLKFDTVPPHMLKYHQGVIDTEKQPALSHRLSAVAPAREVMTTMLHTTIYFHFVS